MSKEIGVGQLLHFQGRCLRLLPKLEVTFHTGTTIEEPPIEVSSLDDAYRLIRDRYPDACWQRWNEQYDPDPYGGFMFDYWDGKDDRDAQISLSFYAQPADVVHDEFRPSGSPLVYEAGWVRWYMVEEK